MHYIYGISKRKIAEMQGVSHTAVNRSLELAVQTIKSILNISEN